MHMKGKVWFGCQSSCPCSKEARRGLTYDESEVATALGVNQEQGGDSEDNLDSTVAERSVQGLVLGVANIAEDARAVEGDDCNLVSNRKRCAGVVLLLLIPHICWANMTVEAP